MRQELAISDYVGLIIAYRDPDLAAGVLARLAEQTVPPRLVLIVDNGGTLGEADRERLPLADRSLLVSRPDNPGYGAAVNEARRHLDGSALLVLTHDAVFGPELAEGLLGVLDGGVPDGGAPDGSVVEGVRIGAAGPLLRLASDPERIFSAGGRLSPSGRASHLQRPLAAAPYRVDWLDGAITMLAPAALEEIGWIAEDYFLYFEDVDTGWRLAQAGWRSVVVPSVVAFQQPGAHPSYLGMRNMALFSRTAGIPAWRSFGAALRRAGREGIGRLRRGASPQLLQAWRGWRDGRAGIGGKPEQPGQPRRAE